MQNAEITFVLTGPDPLVFGLWKDLDFRNHKGINVKAGEQALDATNLQQVVNLIEAAKLAPNDPNDPGGGGSIAVDFEVKYYTADQALLTYPAPVDMDGVPIADGDKVLFNDTRGSADTKKNGAWQAIAADPDQPDVLSWIRPLQFTGIVAQFAPLRVRVNTGGDDEGNNPGSDVDGTVWQMVQTNLEVDVKGNTWVQITIDADTVDAGTFLSGPADPKSAKRPYTNRRMVPDDVSPRLGGINQAQRRPVFNYLRRLRWLSDYMDIPTAYDGRLQIQRALAENDELVIDRRNLRFTGSLDLSQWSRKRLIFEQTKGQDGPTTIYSVTDGNGGIIFGSPGWVIDGYLKIVSATQTHSGVYGLVFNPGARDIYFAEGVSVEGFDANVRINGAGATAGKAIDGIDLGRLTLRKPGNWNMEVSSDATNPVTNIRFRADFDAPTVPVISASVPDNLRILQNVGASGKPGVTVDGGRMTGGRYGVLMTQATFAADPGGSEASRPRNCRFNDLTVEGATADGIYVGFGSDVVLDHVKSRLNQGNGLQLGTRLQGFLRAEHCAFSDNVQHGVYDRAAWAYEKVLDGCAMSGNSSAAANTYSGYAADPGVQNAKLVRCRSGLSTETTPATAWGRIIATPNNGDTFTLDGQAITFVNAVVNPTDVLIGGGATPILATLNNLMAMLLTTANATLLNFTYASDGVDKWYVSWKTPGDTAANGKLLQRSTAARLSVKGGGANIALAGASGSFNQQQYGVKGIANGVRGCVIQDCDLRGNASGAIG